MPDNTLPFLLSTVRMLAEAELATWVFGGWAEELWQISAPRAHHDIDLLYPGEDFAHLDGWIAATAGATEIAGKRFSHKRAVIWRQVMVELLLVQPNLSGWRTCFFAGRYTLDWPADTLLHTIAVEGRSVPVASPAALHGYRQQHACIDQAYQTYIQGQAGLPPQGYVSC